MTRVPLVTVAVVLDAGESLLPDGSAGLGGSFGGRAGWGIGPSSAAPNWRKLWRGSDRAFRSGPGGMPPRSPSPVWPRGWRRPWPSLAEALLRPAFPEEEIDRLRTQRLAAIRQRQMDPGSLADDAAAHFVYSDSVPYHRPLAGTQESVEGLGPEEIRSFVRSVLHGLPGAGMVVVGDVE